MKLIIASLLMLSSVAYGNTAKSSNAEKLALRDSITTYAQEHLGIPYVWGGSSTDGFDCTGFVHYVFKRFGVKVSRASSGYEDKGKEIELTTAQPGDIMLFTGTDPSKKRVGHAGIVLSNTDGTIDFIHSSSSKKHFGVCITRYNESGYVKRYLRVIDVLS